MTATPHGDPARRRCRAPRHHPGDPARSPRGRQRGAARTLARSRALSPRPTTVWPFAEAEPLPGTARLAGWLGRTILTLATGYTRPGDRVLLLAPPTPSSRLGSGPSGVHPADPYAGLTEAVWTITRLGRSTDTATAAPAPDHPTSPTATPIGRGAEAASGPRLGRLAQPRSTDPHRGAALASRHHGVRPADAFDLIITAVRPHAADWLAHTDWDSLLAGTSTLAIVTHSDRVGGRLRDPISVIVNTFRNSARGWLDHIAVLDHPLPPGPRTHSTPGCRSGRPVTAAAMADPMPLRPLHHDLLLFGPVPVKRSDPAPSRASGVLG